jgi:hypothetical protein
MEKQILKEIKELRLLLSSLIGTSDLPVKQRFSKEAITKAAVEFKKLSIDRGEWIMEGDISKIIRKAPYYSGKFIIEKFGFTNYFTRGRYLYFNRKDIIALKDELKLKNINLGRYMELLEDQEKFHKYVESTKDPKAPKKRKRFHIPEELKEIETLPYNHPPREIILKHLDELREEFQKFKLVEYIDVYQDGTYAMFKFHYSFDRYLNADLKKRCKNWCSQFNYANHALKEISKIKSEVIYN